MQLFKMKSLSIGRRALALAENARPLRCTALAQASRHSNRGPRNRISHQLQVKRLRVPDVCPTAVLEPFALTSEAELEDLPAIDTSSEQVRLKKKRHYARLRKN
jgi:hypothetical protein